MITHHKFPASHGWSFRGSWSKGDRHRWWCDGLRLRIMGPGMTRGTRDSNGYQMRQETICQLASHCFVIAETRQVPRLFFMSGSHDLWMHVWELLKLNGTLFQVLGLNMSIFHENNFRIRTSEARTSCLPTPNLPCRQRACSWIDVVPSQHLCCTARVPHVHHDLWCCDGSLRLGLQFVLAQRLSWQDSRCDNFSPICCLDLFGFQIFTPNLPPVSCSEAPLLVLNRRKPLTMTWGGNKKSQSLMFDGESMSVSYPQLVHSIYKHMTVCQIYFPGLVDKL